MIRSGSSTLTSRPNTPDVACTVIVVDSFRMELKLPGLAVMDVTVVSAKTPGTSKSMKKDAMAMLLVIFMVAPLLESTWLN